MTVRDRVKIGTRFTRLTVASEPYTSRIGSNKKPQLVVLTVCDCGNIKLVQAAYLADGRVTSCTCLRAEVARDRMKESKSAMMRSVHCKRLVAKFVVDMAAYGITEEQALEFYPKIRGAGNRRRQKVSRCNNPKDPAYVSYGARGIKVCDAWMNDPHSYYAWEIKSNWLPGYECDRIDRNGDYCPENCQVIEKSENTAKLHRDRKMEIVNSNDVANKLRQWIVENNPGTDMAAKCAEELAQYRPT